MNADQERVRNLLKETVILLCKNGLKFRTSIKVQGLLGITLDNTDIFLVQIDERISEPLDADRLENDDYENASVRTQFQNSGCFEPVKERAVVNQGWIFDKQNVLASTTTAGIENGSNEVRYQDSEICNTFSDKVSFSGVQSVRISHSMSEAVCHIKSENNEDLPMGSDPLEQQNIGVCATRSKAALPVTVSCHAINAGYMNKSSGLVFNQSQGLSETLMCSRSRKNKRKLQKQKTDEFSNSSKHVGPALQAVKSEEFCPSLEGINGLLYSTMKESFNGVNISRTLLESPDYDRSSLFSPTSCLPPNQNNQSLDAQLSKLRPNRFRGSGCSSLPYVPHETLEKLLLRREKTRLRVKKHRLKKKLASLTVKNGTNE